jgi:predicted nucleotidyltransferase
MASGAGTAGEPAVAAIRKLAHGRRGLRLLLLFGSRARTDAGARSDWDLGYLAGAGFDPDGLLAALVEALGTERVDLVDLARAGAQLRYRAASEGQVLHAAEAVTFERFWLEAVSFWCDAGPVIREGYAGVLDRLPS